MMRNVLSVAFSLLFFCGALALAGDAQQKAKREVTVNADYPELGSLELIWKVSDAVVRVRVVSGRAHLQRDPDAPDFPRPMVEHGVEILEVFKEVSDLRVGQRATVEQLTGELEDESGVYSVSERYSARLHPGRDYILFLKKEPTTGKYELSCGPHAVYEIKNGKAEAYGRSYLTSGLESELVARLKSMK